MRTEIHRQNFAKIFNPKSIAVAGTNNVKGTVPYDILYNIIKVEFTGVVFPFSPGEKSICSIKAYKYVLDITDPVDLAIIVFPGAVCHLEEITNGRALMQAARCFVADARIILHAPTIK